MRKKGWWRQIQQDEYSVTKNDYADALAAGWKPDATAREGHAHSMDYCSGCGWNHG